MKRMSWPKVGLLTIVLVEFGFAGQSQAQEWVLKGMNADQSAPVIVWKDLRSLQEGTDLISSGAAKRNPGLLVGIVACVVPSQTRAVASDAPSLGTRNVLITTGGDAGCRGVVNIEVLGS